MVSVGTVIEVADGIARVYGLSGVGYLELVEFPRTGLIGIAFNLEEDSVAVPILGDYTQLHEDDEVRTTGRITQVPVGDALIGRVVNALGAAHRRCRPDRHRQVPPSRARRSRRDHAPPGGYSGADWPQGHRCVDPHRPRPARADHRRPADRQDGHCPGHDHQPEGQRPHLHLRVHRAEELPGRAHPRDPRISTARWSTPSSSMPAPKTRPR